MARPHRSGEMPERIPKTFVAVVRHIEDQPEPFHLLQKLAPARRQRTCVIRPVPVDARPVMHRSQRDQSIGARFFQMPPAQDGISTFEAEQVSDRQLHRVVVARIHPPREMRLDLRPRAELHHLPAILHRPIVRELPLRMRPRLLRAAPAGEISKRRSVARNLRRHADADAPAPHLGKAHRIPHQPWRCSGAEVARDRFVSADLLERPTLVAVEFERVHRDVEVTVEDQARRNERLVHGRKLASANER